MTNVRWVMNSPKAIGMIDVSKMPALALVPMISWCKIFRGKEGLIFVARIFCPFLFNVLKFFLVSFGHLLEHDFFIALSSIFDIAMGLVIAKLLILFIILNLIDLHFL